MSVMNSEFHGRPETPLLSEGKFWMSMEELLPIFEREGISLRLEPHPDHFVEHGITAVDMIRGISSPTVSFMYYAPHTFHHGGDLPGSCATPAICSHRCTWRTVLITRASSSLRFMTNPKGSKERVHQHLDIGQGEVPWDTFLGTLGELRFDGIMTVCVFAWEECARESSVHNLAEIRRRTASRPHVAR